MTSYKFKTVNTRVNNTNNYFEFSHGKFFRYIIIILFINNYKTSVL